MQKLIDFKCPLCDFTDFEHLYKFNTSVMINSEITNWEYEHIICNNCAVIMVYPPPSKKILDEYYENTFPFELNNFQKRQINAAHFINDEINPVEKNVFDIGAGDGFLLKQFADAGWKCNGIEPSNAMTKKAFKKNNIKIINKNFEDFFKTEIDTKYNLVTMSHVLEHVYFPENIIKNIREMLTEDGFLYIEVPSVEGFANEKINNEIMSFTHLWHYTVSSLTNLIQKQGFKKIKIETAVENDFPVIRSIFQREKKIYDNNIGNNEISQTKDYFLKMINIRNKRKIETVKKIKLLFEKEKPVIFYGAGVDMYDLMNSHNTFMKNFDYYLVDSNPKKQGKSLNDKIIENPRIILSFDKPIICITSRLIALKESIRQSISDLKIKDLEVIDLFDNHV